MALFTREELEHATQLVHASMPATPQYRWPLLEQTTGTETWVKHENHTATGAFKIRGGLTFIDGLTRREPDAPGIVTATRGNHGQSQARAATAAGLQAVVVVPHGNSVEKNAAMRAFGAELIEHGEDFDVARLEAARRAQVRGLVMVPPFHRDLVIGVASYAMELFSSQPDLHTVYVPIGCGSGICGLISARDALGLSTRIVGVVSTEADAAKKAFDSGVIGETTSAMTFADGMAVRVVVPDAFEVYSAGAERIVAVSDDEVAEAMRVYYRTTHNLAEGAGAAPLAALLQEREQMRGKRVGVILCGGNVDSDVFAQVLAGQTPAVA
jgi:threonine dehydratase